MIKDGSSWPVHGRIHFCFCHSVAAWCIRFSQEPADQSVVLGERVVLSCVVFNYSGIVQWTKDGLALGIGEGLRGECRGRKSCGGSGRESEKEKKKTVPQGIKVKWRRGITQLRFRFRFDYRNHDKSFNACQSVGPF